MSSSTSAAPGLGSRQDLFIRVFQPVLKQRFSYHFRHLGADAFAEATADCIASAWHKFQRAGDRVWDGSSDRIGKVTPSRLADNIAKSYLHDGREFLGSSVMDVCAAGTHKLDRVRLCSLRGNQLASLHTNEPDIGVIPRALHTADRSSPPTRFRIREDWSTIAAHCRPQARRVLALLARGWKPIEIARKHLRISPARVTALKQEIAVVVANMGYGPRRWQTR
jgi:hypothetical protein